MKLSSNFIPSANQFYSHYVERIGYSNVPKVEFVNKPIKNNGVLKKMLAELNAVPDISAVMCKVKDFISDDLPSEEKQKIKIKSEPYYGLFTGAILIRKNVFDIIGDFDEQVTAGEILDWQTKMKKYNLKIKKLDLVSTNRRIHTSNFGRTQQKTEFKDYAKSLRDRLNMIKNKIKDKPS